MLTVKYLLNWITQVDIKEKLIFLCFRTHNVWCMRVSPSYISAEVLDILERELKVLSRDVSWLGNFVNELQWIPRGRAWRRRTWRILSPQFQWNKVTSQDQGVGSKEDHQLAQWAAVGQCEDVCQDALRLKKALKRVACWISWEREIWMRKKMRTEIIVDI